MSFTRARLTRFNETAGDGPPVGAYNPHVTNHTPTPKFIAPKDPTSSLSTSQGSTPSKSFRVPRLRASRSMEHARAQLEEMMRAVEERDALIVQLQLTKNRMGAKVSQLQAQLRDVFRKAQKGHAAPAQPGTSRIDCPNMDSSCEPGPAVLQDVPEPVVRLSCGTDELKDKIEQFMQDTAGQGLMAEEEAFQSDLVVALEEQENRNATLQKENEKLKEDNKLQTEKLMSLEANCNERERELRKALEEQKEQHEKEIEKSVALWAKFSKKEKEQMEVLEEQRSMNTALQKQAEQLQKEIDLKKEELVAYQVKCDQKEKDLTMVLKERESENNFLKKEKERLEQEIETHRENSMALQATIHKQAKELAEVLEDRESMNSALKKQNIQLCAIQQEIETLSSQEADLLSKIDFLKSLVSSKDKEVFLLADSKLCLQAQLSGAQNYVVKLQNLLAEEKELRKSCLHQKEIEVDSLKGEVAKLCDQLHLTSKTKLELELLCASNEESMKLLQAENTRLELLQNTTEKDLLAASSRGDKYKEVCREIETQKGKLEERLRELSKLPKQVAEVEHLKTQLDEMMQQANRWRSKYEAIESAWAQYQDVVEMYELEVRVLEQQKQATESEVEKLKETVTKSMGHQNHRQKISYLRKILEERSHYKQELALKQAVIETLEKKLCKLCRPALPSRPAVPPKLPLKENVEPRVG